MGEEQYLITDFNDLGVSKELLRGIHAFGFETPSLIQRKTCLAIKKGIDIVGQSQAGTGKTGAFTVGTLSRIDPKLNALQAIILAPTRVLSDQIYYVVTNISQYMGINVCLCVGGINSSIVNLKEAMTSHILVGTPGRVVDLLKRENSSKQKMINTHKLKILVMDEADVLLDSDFKIQMQEIIKLTSENTQICIFSATFRESILEETKNLLKPNPFHVKVDKEKLSLELIKQYKIQFDNEKYKPMALSDLYQKLQICQSMIFTNEIETAISLSNYMTKEGHATGLLHGKMSFENINEVLKKFRIGEIRILICSNVLARGIDVECVGIVINFDLPDSPETYVHRIGRSGRYGKHGIAISFVTDKESQRVKEFVSIFKKEIEDLPENLSVLNYALMGS